MTTATTMLLALSAWSIVACQSDVTAIHTSVAGDPVPQYRRQEPTLSTAVLAAPREYSALRVASPLIIDGNGSDVQWEHAAWTDDFTDIEGPTRAVPRQRTRVKMTWDDRALYVLAELSETDLWAVLKKHDEIVFQDNDFEIFVDPDGDTREYYEIEVNALGTVFDLYLPETYRAGTTANHGWNANAMSLAIGLDGTLNDSTDIDRGWTVEMALPWSIFEPVVANGIRSFQVTSRPPDVGDAWRINFSRVQWTLEKMGNSYTKVPGKPEDNWVWSPQWIVDMHVPQWWGRVKFVEAAKENRL